MLLLLINIFNWLSKIPVSLFEIMLDISSIISRISFKIYLFSIFFYYPMFYSEKHQIILNAFYANYINFSV